MSIVRIFEDLINGYNEDQKCGLCWSFTHARKDYANLKKYDCGDSCCVHFILEDWEEKKGFEYDKQFGLSELKYLDYSFDVVIGSMARLDHAIFNECDDCECDTQYCMHVEPLLTCLQDLEIDVCGSHSTLMSWSAKPLYNYNDANLSGLRVRGTIRTHI